MTYLLSVAEIADTYGRLHISPESADHMLDYYDTYTPFKKCSMLEETPITISNTSIIDRERLETHIHAMDLSTR
jgi:hypothetical protein